MLTQESVKCKFLSLYLAARHNRLTRGGKGVRVALMEAAGEMLQHALSLLRLSYQHHHFEKRPKKERK